MATQKRLAEYSFKNIIYAIISLFMIIMALLALKKGAYFAGYYNLIFFGLCFTVFVISFLPNANYLELSAEGFVVCSLYRKWRVRWEDVDMFIVGYVAGKQRVCWNYSDKYRIDTKMSKFSRFLVGADAGLPGNYGLTPEELCELFNRYKLSGRVDG